MTKKQVKKKVSKRKAKPTKSKNKVFVKSRFDMIDESDGVAPIPDFDATLTFVMKNDTDNQQQVNLFSLTEKFAEGVTVDLMESNYDFMLKMLQSNIHFVSGFRLTYDNIFSAINGVQILHKNVYGNTSKYPVLPLLYFSPYQYQSSIIECYPFNIAVRGGTEMRFLMEPKSKMTCNLFCSNKYNSYESYLEDVSKNNKSLVSPRIIPIVIENNRDEKQLVSLFDLDDAKHIDFLPVKISTAWAHGSYEEVLMQLSHSESCTMGAIKFYSENTNQINNPLFSNDWDEEEGLNLMDSLNAFQEQGKVIDAFPITYKWNKFNPIKLTIEPKTKAVYFFTVMEEKFKGDV